MLITLTILALATSRVAWLLTVGLAALALILHVLGEPVCPVLAPLAISGGCAIALTAVSFVLTYRLIGRYDRGKGR